ncbi:MAG: DUF3168 domain-containing protein [Desulfobacterales bacterium]
MIDDNVYAFLAAQSALTSIVSTRIYHLNLDEKPTYPAITYRDDDHDIDETFEGNTCFTKSDYYIDAWDTTRESVNTLAAAIKTVLKNHTGDLGGIDVQRCVVTSIEGMIYEDSVRAYRKTQLFSIWHNEG